jgi:hypothetical protein
MDDAPTLDVLGEFAGIVLPDKRLIDRLRAFVGSFLRNPSACLPDLLGDVASVEGGYRLLRNKRVCLDALHAPHRQRTIERSQQQSSVVVVHDTTTVETPWADPSEVGYLSTGKTGYLAHASLAVGIAPGRPLLPLGVLNIESIFRAQRSKSHKKQPSGADTARWKDKEFERWQRGLEASASALDGCSSVIHVMDREADCYALFSRIEELAHGFVIRLRLDRRAREVDEQADEEPEWSRLGELAADMEGLCVRDVPLSKRGDKRAPASLKTHPPRESRCARLHFSARQVEIAKPKWTKAAPASLTLGLVRVWEPDPPNGEDPVEWLLITNEPCETPDEVVRVVDLYRCRWIIEEFFKTLKSGCALEKRQFESRTALLNILAISLPTAVHLLWIRSCARDTPDAPATDVFTPLQLTVLRQISHRKMPENPNARDALWVLAGLGGHMPNNGWPGWKILGRAYVKLMDGVRVWQLAMDAVAAGGAVPATGAKM